MKISKVSRKIVGFCRETCCAAAVRDSVLTSSEIFGGIEEPVLEFLHSALRPRIVAGFN